MRGILVTLLVNASVLCNTASAQSIAGEWNAEVRSPGGIGRPTIVFQVRGDTLTGTLRRPTGDTVPLQGSIKGDTVTFSYTIDYQGTPLDITVRAIVAGDSLAGSADFGGMASGSFNATRATPTRPPGERLGSHAGRLNAPPPVSALAFLVQSSVTGVAVVLAEARFWNTGVAGRRCRI